MGPLTIRRCAGNKECWAIEDGTTLCPATSYSLDNLVQILAGRETDGQPVTVTLIIDRQAEFEAANLRRARDLAEAKKQLGRTRLEIQRLERGGVSLTQAQIDEDMRLACEAE